MKMKNKTSFFKNKLFIYIVLAVFIVSIAVVFAAEDYNSSRSNTVTSIMLQDLGVNESEILSIFYTFDREIDSYARYKDARANTAVVMKSEGVNDADAKRILQETGISDKRVELVGSGSFSINGGLEVFRGTAK